ncbi:MAG: dihydroorotase [Pirellulaceae bacterium]
MLDATGLIVSPGLIDLCTQLREPGFEDDETIATGAKAAIRGGFTTIACVPNTDPPIDTQAGVEFILNQSRLVDLCRVEVLACVSKGREGKELAELGSLSAAGAIGFTDATSPIFNADLMRRALEYCQMFRRPILNRPEVPELNRDGVMHEGVTSTILGLSGMPAEAEDVMAGRDVRLAEATHCPVHLLGISCKDTVDLIRRSKQRNVPVSASIAAINLTVDDSTLRSFDTNWKINPPLRSQEHIDSCIAGVADGTIDAIISNHAPRAAEKKMDVLDTAPYGMVGLETVLGIVGSHLVRPGHVSWARAIELLSSNPAKILGLPDRGTLRPGSLADLTIFDPSEQWTVDTKQFVSRSSNSPLHGWKLLGRTKHVIVGGRIKVS